LPAIRSASGVILSGVCSRNVETMKRTVEEFGCRSWSSPEEMLRDGAVHIVYVSTPTGLHATHGSEVLAAGRHLWCEKPIVERLTQARGLTELSRQRAVMVGEAFMYLYHPQFRAIRHIVGSGRLGKLRGVTCRFGIPPLDRPGFRLTPSLGGGAFLDVGSYPVSVAVALFPESSPDVLYAEVTAEDGSPVDSSGRAILAYPDGVRLTLEWGTRAAYRNEIDVWGTDGSVLTDRIFSKPADYVPRLRFLDRHGRESFEEGQSLNHFIAMVEAFRGLVEDATAAERERVDIERRAALLDRIRDAAL